MFEYGIFNVIFYFFLLKMWLYVVLLGFIKLVIKYNKFMLGLMLGISEEYMFFG